MATSFPAESNNPSLGTITQAVVCVAGVLVTLLLSGCGGAELQSSTATVASTADRNYPAPPPPLQSNTQILSGGWVINGDGTEPLFDHIVVVSDGAIVAIGKRGTIDVPADSVGVDASGKWILPGPADLLAAQFKQRQHDSPSLFTGTNFAPLSTGRSADLVMLNRNPLLDPQALGDVHALVIGGEVKLIVTDDSGSS